MVRQWGLKSSVIGIRARKLDGTDTLGESSARARPIAEPVPRRLVSANFENASRIPTFGSVRVFGHDAFRDIFVCTPISSFMAFADTGRPTRSSFFADHSWKFWPKGRPTLPEELKKLIAEMVVANITWGEERIAHELLVKLSIRVSPRTVRRQSAEFPPRRRRARRTSLSWLSARRYAISSLRITPIDPCETAFTTGC